MFELPCLRVTGSTRAMGLAHGEHWRHSIQAFVDIRLRTIRVNLYQAGIRDDAGFLALCQQSLRQLADWHPTGYTEHLAVAEGATVDPVRLFAAYNLTDLRDVAMFGEHRLADQEGCTACLVPSNRSRSGHLLQAQTWDLNPPDIDYVVAVHRLPENGPETWSVSLTGAPSLMGMNQHGLSVGTTNIKTTDSRPGIGYMNLLHRALQCTDASEAEALVQAAPRAAAHTFWLADTNGGVELECSASRVAIRRCQDQAIVQTNHCLADHIAELAAETPSSSSRARLQRATQLLAANNQDVASLQALFADRDGDLDAINRLHEDGTDTATNACIIMSPATRDIWACRGPSDQGRWLELAFERA